MMSLAPSPFTSAMALGLWPFGIWTPSTTDRVNGTSDVPAPAAAGVATPAAAIATAPTAAANAAAIQRSTTDRHAAVSVLSRLRPRTHPPGGFAAGTRRRPSNQA